MSSILLDLETHDIKLVDNAIVLVTGIDAIRQHLKCRFLLFLGEWFLDTTIGVPYFRDILIKNPSFVVVQEVLKSVILDTPGVILLLQFDFSFESVTRVARLEFQALTLEGTIDFSQAILLF